MKYKFEQAEVVWFVLLLVFVLMCLLTGCEQINSGTITGKRFSPRHMESSITLDFDGNPKVDSEMVPDRWYVTFEKVDEDGGLKSRTISVSKQEYEVYKVGQWIALR